jgi:RimJ/RimL family protein N-acetyltransferase
MMLDYVYGYDAIVADFVAQLVPHCRRGFGTNIKTIGVVDAGGVGVLIAGIVYHNWDPEAGIIEISGAALPGQPWLSRETLKRMFQYPFLVCNCQMVVQRTPADDERLLYVLARYGYAFSGVPRLFGRNRDGVICCLTREAWESNKFNARLRHHMPPEPIREAA